MKINFIIDARGNKMSDREQTVEVSQNRSGLVLPKSYKEHLLENPLVALG